MPVVTYCQNFKSTQRLRRSARKTKMANPEKWVKTCGASLEVKRCSHRTVSQHRGMAESLHTAQDASASKV
jgi:hypothetical protein